MFLSVSVKMIPATMMLQSKKDGANPTNFISSLYNLGTWFLMISKVGQKRTTGKPMKSLPQAETLLKNSWKAEYSQFIAKLLIQQKFQMPDSPAS